VVVEVAAADRRARLVVRDGGVGIAPDALPRVFEKFERAPATRGHGGLGLGLYIVRQIVELHGGTVRAASAPGAGTELIVELPLD
jgi:signal transduction histidine kinase